MNKTDRLLAIVLELQRCGLRRAEDLAATFETSVRTIYRDIQALSEAGVPIAGTPGQGYSLMEGYFLPPVSFTVEEAVSLLIGTDFVTQEFAAGYAACAEASRRKIDALLPQPVREEADRARRAIRLLSERRASNRRPEKERLDRLHQAILDRRMIRFQYTKAVSDDNGNRDSIRDAAPYGLVLVRGIWMLIAYCHLRQAIRHFRVSRMTDLAVLEERFAFPPDFLLSDYTPPDDRTVRVRLQVDACIADQVAESNTYYMESAEPCPEGMLVTCRVRRPEDLLSWVLGWGGNVVVLEPESLRRLVREEAKKISDRY
ncbi:helix-turn-helix transcriptional regulator [Paenibacillus dendritiformis]|uniref:helix-turn-helix transcriptional regulator n=1 Tax=Paenibacillus dendritiformis TaxID=130049 RepID=UPI00387E0BFF